MTANILYAIQAQFSVGTIKSVAIKHCFSLPVSSLPVSKLVHVIQYIDINV